MQCIENMYEIIDRISSNKCTIDDSLHANWSTFMWYVYVKYKTHLLRIVSIETTSRLREREMKKCRGYM